MREVTIMILSLTLYCHPSRLVYAIDSRDMTSMYLISRRDYCHEIANVFRSILIIYNNSFSIVWFRKRWFQAVELLLVSVPQYYCMNTLCAVVKFFRQISSRICGHWEKSDLQGEGLVKLVPLPLLHFCSEKNKSASNIWKFLGIFHWKKRKIEFLQYVCH